jgi:hypothetical protein
MKNKRMNTKLKVYDVLLGENDFGLSAISFVDEPAIEQDFIYFNHQKSLMFKIEDKQEVISPVLIPEQLIYRFNKETQEEFYIKWSADVIAETAIKFILEQQLHNTTIMHPTFIDKNLKLEDCLVKDVYMIKLWLIEDAKTDIMNTKYGYDLPEGTLCVHYKIYNQDLWNRIKQGELRGLSVEAFMTIKNVSMKKIKQENNKSNIEKMNKKMSFLNKFILFLNEVADEAEGIATIVKDDLTNSGDVTLSYILDSGAVLTVDAEGIVRDVELTPVQGGEYLLEDGNTLVVGEDNKFVEVHKTIEKEPIEAPINQEDEMGKITIEGVEYEVPKAVMIYIEELEGWKTEEEKEVAQFKESISNMKLEMEKLKARTPSTEPVPTVQVNNKTDLKEDSVENRIANALKKISNK